MKKSKLLTSTLLCILFLLLLAGCSEKDKASSTSEPKEKTDSTSSDSANLEVTQKQSNQEDTNKIFLDFTFIEGNSSDSEYEKYFKAIERLKTVNEKIDKHSNEPLGPQSWIDHLVKNAVNENNTTDQLKYFNLMADWTDDVNLDAGILTQLKKEKTAISKGEYNKLVS